MPQVVEVTSGAGESNSKDSGPSKTRAFRVILNSPGEVVSYETVCGITIGQEEGGLKCLNYDARFEGDSRMVVLVTFQYGVDPNDDPGSGQDPSLKPANWSVSAVATEGPALTWRKRTGAQSWGNRVVAANPVGDIYDGVSALYPAVKISVSQWESSDPTRNCGWVGYVNSESITLGSLTMAPHTCLFMGLQSTAAVETYGQTVYRGWRVDYEFAYKHNEQLVTIGGQEQVLGIGWDIAIPQTGFNVKAFNPPAARADQDVFGQPLAHGERGTKFYLQIPPPPYALGAGIEAGKRVRAMVHVHSYANGGSSQAPSAEPIALNDDGTPRLIAQGAAPPLANIAPIVYAYSVYPDTNLSGTLGLRLR